MIITSNNISNTFDKNWFKKYQKILLFLCNFFITRYWFRWILRINKVAKYSEKIVELLPNNYKSYLGNNKYKAVFSIHDKYSQRIYNAFKYWWMLFHLWDEIVADEYLPELSFGFQSLTRYYYWYPQIDCCSDTGTTCDGYVWRDTPIGSTFSSIQSGNGNNHLTSEPTDSNHSVCLLAYSTSNNYKRLVRGIATFDLTSLPRNINISDIILTLFGGSKGNDLGSTSFVISTSDKDLYNDIRNSDYERTSFNSTLGDRGPFGEIAYDDFKTGFDGAGKMDIPLSGETFDSYISSIDIYTTPLTLAYLLGWDFYESFTGSWSSQAWTGMIPYTSEAGYESDKPYLTIVYSLTFTSIVMTFI